MQRIKYKIKIGVEAFFKIKPTILGTFTEIESESESEIGFGTTSSLGFAGRYDVFTLGLEFNFGSITTTSTSTDFLGNEVEVDFDNDISNTRFFIGFRF